MHTISPRQIQSNPSTFQGQEHNFCGAAHHEHSDSLIPLIAIHRPLVPVLTDLNRCPTKLSKERT